MNLAKRNYTDQGDYGVTPTLTDPRIQLGVYNDEDGSFREYTAQERAAWLQNRSSASRKRDPRSSTRVQPQLGDRLPELLTVKDFLKRFSIGHTTFYREVGLGRLKITKFGRATRVARADALAWSADLGNN